MQGTGNYPDFSTMQLIYTDELTLAEIILMPIGYPSVVRGKYVYPICDTDHLNIVK